MAGVAAVRRVGTVKISGDSGVAVGHAPAVGVVVSITPLATIDSVWCGTSMVIMCEVAVGIGVGVHVAGRGQLPRQHAAAAPRAASGAAAGWCRPAARL
jgi:hypothetical protein